MIFDYGLFSKSKQEDINTILNSNELKNSTFNFYSLEPYFRSSLPYKGYYTTYPNGYISSTRYDISADTNSPSRFIRIVANNDNSFINYIMDTRSGKILLNSSEGTTFENYGYCTFDTYSIGNLAKVHNPNLIIFPYCYNFYYNYWYSNGSTNSTAYDIYNNRLKPQAINGMRNLSNFDYNGVFELTDIFNNFSLGNYYYFSGENFNPSHFYLTAINSGTFYLKFADSKFLQKTKFEFDISKNIDISFVNCLNFNTKLNIPKCVGFNLINCPNFNQKLDNINPFPSINTFSLQGCINFNQEIDQLNFGDLSDASYMFANCYKFNMQIANLINKVNSMNFLYGINRAYMFENCHEFNQPIPNIYIDNEDIHTIVLNTNANNVYYTSQVYNNLVNNSNLQGMFKGCKKFNQPINVWCAFNYASTDQPYPAYDMSHFLESTEDFNSTITINGPYNNFSYFFANSMINPNILYNFLDFINEKYELNNQNPNMVICNYLFSGTKFNKSITIRKNMRCIEGMFANCTLLNQPISFEIPYIFQSTNTRSFANFFEGCTNFNQPVYLPIHHNWLYGTSYNNAFRNCHNFNSIIDFVNIENYPDINGNQYLSYIHYADNCFADCYSLKNLDLCYNFLNKIQTENSYWDGSNLYRVTNRASNLFRNCYNLVESPFINLSDYMYYNCNNLKTIKNFIGTITRKEGYISSGRYSKTFVNYSHTFYNCQNLENCIIDSINCNAYNQYATIQCDFSYMYYNCKKVHTYQNFNLIATNDSWGSVVVNCSHMFDNCLNINMNVTISARVSFNGDHMFYNCTNFSPQNIYLSGSGANFTSTFENCVKLKDTDINIYIQNSGGDLSNIFKNCRNLTNTGNIYYYAYYNQNYSMVNFTNAFTDCTNLRTIYNRLNCLYGTNFFVNCYSLTEINGINISTVINYNYSWVNNYYNNSYKYMSRIFVNCNQINKVNNSYFNGISSYIFYNCQNLYSIENTTIVHRPFHNDPDNKQLFYNTPNLKYINNLNFIADMADNTYGNLFLNCNNLTSISMNFSMTNLLTNSSMSEMKIISDLKNLNSINLYAANDSHNSYGDKNFYLISNCPNLKFANITFNTTFYDSINDNSYMFYNCPNLLYLSLNSLGVHPGFIKAPNLKALKIFTTYWNGLYRNDFGYSFYESENLSDVFINGNGVPSYYWSNSGVPLRETFRNSSSKRLNLYFNNFGGNSLNGNYSDTVLSPNYKGQASIVYGEKNNLNFTGNNPWYNSKYNIYVYNNISEEYFDNLIMTEYGITL